MNIALRVQAFAGLAGGLALGAIHFTLPGHSVALATAPGSRCRAVLYFLLRLVPVAPGSCCTWRW